MQARAAWDDADRMHVTRARGGPPFFPFGSKLVLEASELLGSNFTDFFRKFTAENQSHLVRFAFIP